jgi:two-component system NtrC family response regulator
VSTVLVVEADPKLCRRWSSALEITGHSVLVAQRLTDGINRVREGGIDLIFLDPGDGPKGLEYFVIALGRLPDPPPFILISSSPKAPEISAQVGAAAFLPKPCTGDDIVHLTSRFAAMPVQEATIDDEPDDEPTDPRRELFRI